MMKRIIITGAQILFEQKWLTKHALVIEDNIITAIVPDHMIKHHLPAIKYEFAPDHYLVPGFIDLHIHGANGKDVMDGDPEGLVVISNTLAREGVTGFLATTLSAGQNELENILQVIVETSPRVEGAAILGIHLEGPFIAPEKVGAHDVNMVQNPEPELLKKWQRLADGNIKIITLAPELPDALMLIDSALKLKMIVSIGHTNATYKETEAAIAAGATQATHLFNAMRGLHQREPGAITALLLADDVSVELIMDGLHLHPTLAQLVLRLKGKDHIFLVTDAMRGKGLVDGEYQLGNNQVTVNKGKAELSDGTLAGSTLRMPQAIKNMVSYSKCSLIDAILMATRNPAHALDLYHRKGSIEMHKDADVVVLNKNFAVVLTLREGKEVFKLKTVSV